MLSCLALTFVNPHVYIDTVMLLGSVANTRGDPLRWFFGAGATVASAIWFCALGFGARYLAGVFDRPNAWRVLDAGIAAIMIAIAVGLVI